METTYDAIVVGGGHNGLVTALYLAKAGWSVAVVERNETVGGAIASGEVTLPGFVHDLYSTNQNLFLGSAAFADFACDLARRGFTFRTTARPYSNAFPDGRRFPLVCNARRGTAATGPAPSWSISPRPKWT